MTYYIDTSDMLKPTIAKRTYMIGGPFSYNYHSSIAMTTNIVKVGQFIGHYSRNSPYAHEMKWVESMKKWYLVKASSNITTEKLEKLGCLGIVYNNHITVYKGKRMMKVCIDVDSSPTAFTAFELVYSEDIEYSCEKLYRDRYEFESVPIGHNI